MKSADDLFNKALSIANAVGAGQTASAEDLVPPTQALGPLLAELAEAEGITVAVDLTDTTSEDIPEALFIPLAMLLANEIIPDFGGDYDPRVRTSAIMRMKKVMAADANFTTQRSEYF